MKSKKSKQAEPKTLSSRVLWLIGGASLVAALICKAPASLAPAIARAAGVDISVERTTGTLWNGELAGVYARGVRLGDIRFMARPLSLLVGRLVVDMSARGGALTGAGRASVTSTGVFSMRHSRFVFDLSAANRYAILGQPMSGAVKADIDEVVVARDGCVRAGAKLWTDMLAAPAKRVNAEKLDLAGRGACDGRDLVVTLPGESGDGAVSMMLRIAPDLTYTLAAEAAPARTEVADTLRFLGFERREGGMAIATSGVIRAVGS